MAYEWLKYCNKTNLKKRGDYGVRVARPGFDAMTCADNLLIFNSGWPILQLCDVIDFDKANYTYTRYQLPNGDWSDELPEGYTLAETYVDTTQPKYGVNSRFARMYVETGDYWDDNYENEILAYTYKRMSHNLGYVPFFLDADDVSGESTNKLLLFTLDIETDVDYPYTEEALPFISAPNDYGMKSSSVFGNRVPGLSTGQFSKLAQAIKTQETAVFTEEESRTKIPIWSPLSSQPSESITTSPLVPFEAFGFAIVGDGLSGSLKYDNKDGGYYTPVYARSIGDDGDDMAYVYSLQGQAESYFYKTSLVVLRSPLVTPDYEEVEI